MSKATQRLVVGGVVTATQIAAVVVQIVQHDSTLLHLTTPAWLVYLGYMFGEGLVSRAAKRRNGDADAD